MGECVVSDFQPQRKHAEVAEYSPRRSREKFLERQVPISGYIPLYQYSSASMIVQESRLFCGLCNDYRAGR